MAIGPEIRTHAAGLAAVASRLCAASALALLLAIPAPKPGLSASLQPVGDFGPNPGALDLYVHVPDGHEPNASLVVALHGCTQGAGDFDDESGLVGLADALNFVLLFPEQHQANNDRRCFNWFRLEDNRRDRGEAGSIGSMVQYAIDTYDVDPSKIFVLGLSAGGSMAAVLMAAYPELFEGGAILSGTPYGCNNPGSLWDGHWWWFGTWFGEAAAASYACGLLGYAPTERSADAWGDYVRAAAGATPDASPDRWPRVALWHGADDDIVDPANLRELVKQWTNVHGIDQDPDQSEVSGAIRHQIYRDADGNPLVESYEIAGFGHALAVDPGPGPEQCGMAAPHVMDADICSTLKILEFWGVAP